MPLQQAALGIAFGTLIAAGYSLVSTWTMRRTGPGGLSLVWAVCAAGSSTGLVVKLGLFAGRFERSTSVLITLFPVFTTAGSSLLIWRLQKRDPAATVRRCLGHGMAGFVFGLLALLLVAIATDVAHWF